MSLENNNNIALIKKYNVAGPRYTSYPTVPLWENEKFNVDVWKNNLVAQFYQNQEVTLYIHLPYCESLCTYCGCNTRITVNHAVEKTYIASLLKEWDMYLNLFSSQPILKEIHLGGGTPTFFSPENLHFLISSIQATCIIPSDKSYSFEGHPANTTKLHIDTLAKLGFNRVSYGIQDFDEKIQDVINRKQSIEEVNNVTAWSKEAKYTSINYDLIYGLPFQTIESITKTIQQVCELKPDRIAYYSYAHVPWLKPGQRKYSEKDLPDNDYKRKLYEVGKEILMQAGYQEIGMDHFALANDELFVALANKKLHRNFMGYTVTDTKLLIGLGVSSISDAYTCFAQNVKTVEEYHSKINANELPVYRGHELNQEDLQFRSHIMNIMCNLETTFTEIELQDTQIKDIVTKLKPLMEDGLVNIRLPHIEITELGKAFVRNVAMVFDQRLARSEQKENRFSKTI